MMQIITLKYFYTVIELSALFYSIYMLFLRRTAGYTLHRWYLLLALIIPLLVPFLRFEISVSHFQILPLKAMLPVVPGLFEDEIADPGSIVINSAMPVASTIFSYILFGGMLFSLMRICLHGILVFRVLRSCKKKVFKNTVVFVSGQVQYPFSFAGKIIIPASLFQHQENLEMIIAHEAEHTKRYHHSDLLIYALCQVICWWNPIIYFIRRQLAIVHEFEADAAVVSYYDRSTYARLLLSATFNVSTPIITNLVFQSPIKLRIMRFYENNKKPRLHPFWFALPVVVCIIFVFCVSFVPVHTSGPIRPYKIAIDAGHGGIDAGTARGGSTEKYITLKVAQMIAKEAADAGIEVVMTRTGDDLPVPGDINASLRQRVEIVKASNPDVFVSIHTGAANDNYNGVDAFVSGTESETTNRSKAFAASILHNMQKGPLKVNMQIKQRKNEGIWVLDKSPVPTVLLELGYLTNDVDFKVLSSDENLEKMASLIVEAIKIQSGQ